MKTCRHCKCQYEPATWQIARGDYECTPCRLSVLKAYRAARKAAGNPVVSGKASKEHKREYAAKYFQRQEARDKRNLHARQRRTGALRDRYLARLALRHAVNFGEIRRLPCLVCGEEKTEGHHVAYDMPLDVVWLCRPHHFQLHAEAKAAARGEA